MSEKSHVLSEHTIDLEKFFEVIQINLNNLNQKLEI